MFVLVGFHRLRSNRSTFKRPSMNKFTFELKRSFWSNRRSKLRYSKLAWQNVTDARHSCARRKMFCNENMISSRRHELRPVWTWRIAYTLQSDFCILHENVSNANKLCGCVKFYDSVVYILGPSNVKRTVIDSFLFYPVVNVAFLYRHIERITTLRANCSVERLRPSLDYHSRIQGPMYNVAELFLFLVFFHSFLLVWLRNFILMTLYSFAGGFSSALEVSTSAKWEPEQQEGVIFHELDACTSVGLKSTHMNTIEYHAKLFVYIYIYIFFLYLVVCIIVVLQYEVFIVLSIDHVRSLRLPSVRGLRRSLDVVGLRCLQVHWYRTCYSSIRLFPFFSVGWSGYFIVDARFDYCT